MRPVIVVHPVTPPPPASASGLGPEDDRELSSWRRRAAIGELAVGMARDFNNLLTAVRASCDLLLAELDTRDPLREEVAAITRTSDQAVTLARVLVALGRDHTPEVRPIDPASLVTSLEPILLRLLDPGIELVTDVRPMRPVLGDRALIERALLTLVIQARDAFPVGGQLTVSVFPRTLHDPVSHRHGAIPPGEYGAIAVRYEGGAPPDDRGLEPPFVVTRRCGEGAEVMAYFPVDAGRDRDG